MADTNCVRYVRIGKRRIRVPKRRGTRLALGLALMIRGLIPPLGFIALPAAMVILAIDIPLLRRWRRRSTVWLGRRRRPKRSRSC
jgi:hypothetical protein